MSLNTAQIAQLKTAMAAETDPAFVQARTDGNSQAMADFFNSAAPVDFIVWNSATQVQAVFDAISWASLTPADAPDGTGLFTNRALACQAKQFNIQILLQGRTAIDANKANVRQGLRDALQNVPAGAAGALLDAGWTPVKAALTRKATRAEKLITSGTATVANPVSLVFDGMVTDQDVIKAAAS